MFAFNPVSKQLLLLPHLGNDTPVNLPLGARGSPPGRLGTHSWGHARLASQGSTGLAGWAVPLLTPPQSQGWVPRLRWRP